MSSNLSLRAILLGIIAVSGLLAMLFALITGEAYTRITLDNQRVALGELIKLKADEILKDIDSNASELGLSVQSGSEFNQAFDNGDRDALVALLERQFHQYFVTAGTLDLIALRVYDAHFTRLASTTTAGQQTPTPCPQLIDRARLRLGPDRLQLIDDVCLTEAGGVAHNIVVPIGGLRVKGYLEIEVNPIGALKSIEPALGMSLKLNLPDRRTIYRSPDWPPPDRMDNALVASHMLTDTLGQPVLSIAIQDDMGALRNRLTGTRYWVMGIAGTATVLVALLVLGLLHRIALRPLDTLTQHLRKVQEDRAHLGDPVALAGTSEIRELTLDFNEMTAELKDLYQTLEQMAFTDALTRLPNRSRFQERLQVATAIGRRQQVPFALLLMDLDRFKGVNDTLGHHVGDQLLKMVSDRLRNTLRDASKDRAIETHETRADGNMIARLGGDEFAAILPAVGARQEAALIAQRLLACMEHPFMVEGHQFNIGISIGIVLYPEHGHDPSVLMRHADVAMYNAKNTQRGFCFYDSGQDDHSLQKLMLEHDLRHALENEILEVYYQPKIDLRTGMICGAEALLRWPHPTRGFIPPDLFIREAELSGLIHPITYWVLNRAVHECARWHRTGLSISVAVNISAVMFREPTTSMEIHLALKRAGLAPEHLVLELTESTVMSDPEYAQRILGDLDGMGVQLSIDDFGTGYSSLSYLRRLPVDEVKIDKSFVIDMHNNAHDAVIVRSTIDLAHNMHMRVVAEGVEDVETLRCLTDWNCDLVQGYYLGHPIPADQFFALLSEHGYKPSQALG